MIKFVELDLLPPTSEKYYQLFIDGKPRSVYSESVLKRALNFLDELC